MKENRVRLQKLFDTRSRGCDHAAQVATMNARFDSVMARCIAELSASPEKNCIRDEEDDDMDHQSVVTTLLLDGSWVVDGAGTRVNISEDMWVEAGNIRRRDVCDVETMVLDVCSKSLSTRELISAIQDIVDRRNSHFDASTGSQRYFLDLRQSPASMSTHHRLGLGGNGGSSSHASAIERMHRLQSAPKNLVFDRHIFTSNKTFKSLVGSNIRALERRVRFFMNHRDWYTEKGVPYQLGIMLSGTSGSGKSSAIRAIANETGRHIINLSFAGITTASQLKRLFQSEELHIYDSDDATEARRVTIPIHQRLYVIEEIDALGSIVLERRQERQEAAKADALPDELTLADLLQVLDGNMETPGRMLVITSNYPERLDSALVRPGRVDIDVRFGMCRSDDIKELYEHIRGQPFTISQEDLDALDGKLSMAEASEAILSTYEDLPSDTISALKKIKM